MGKEWHWSGRSSKRGGGAETEIPSGCMCAMFQAFDFHPFHFSINQQQSSIKSRTPEDHTVLKGAEAPRSSLESETGTTVSSISKEENFKIPKNIRIKTRGSGTRSRTESFSDLSSEISASPGTKTPTLVARLMGLDLLPDAHSSSSPSLSTPNLHKPRQHIKIIKHRNSTGSNTLPETPRMSSGRRSDVEHRLSLQINKENNTVPFEDFESPRFSFSKRKYYENSCRSPSHYARQIVKQVKESVSRKVGLDITNTVKNREHGREESVGQFKFKKTPKTSVNESSPGKHSNSSYSPRLSRFIDTKHKPSTTPPSPTTPKNQNTHSILKPPSPTTSKNQNPHSILKPPSPPPVVNIETQLSRVLTKPKPQALPENDWQNQKSATKGKNTSSGKLSSRVNKPPQTSIRNKQEESFITRPPSATKANDIKTKSKRTHPLSSNLLNNLNTVPNLLPVKTRPSPQKQSQVRDGDDDARDAKRSAQLFSSSGLSYKQEAPRPHSPRGGTTSSDDDKSHGTFATTTGADDDDEGPEYQYITTILTRSTTTTGPHNSNLPHLQFQWFSPTHPLDPSVFHRLEHYTTSNSFVSFPSDNKDCIFKRKQHLGPRCNRRLLFDLVDELLSEILVRPRRYKGALLETVWERVRSFPRAKCEVLEDIDALIEMEEMKKDEEGEGLVKEIERSMFETLVHETFTVMVGGVDTKGKC
ncbi:Protein LONGIFOLIA 2 [Glycine soja]